MGTLPVGVAVYTATISRLRYKPQLCYGGCVLSTADVAAMAGTSQDTVEREIDRGNLEAAKVGRTWVIEAAEARRWAAQFRPYAGLRKQPDSLDGGTRAAIR
jgi:excisionase family DNA binding protein